jgi:exopolyphosphatase/guanosine-5'-triphosphate,3'-diphosphate pyrophosphatase
VLREVNADGLEQWTPVMKAGFPLPAAEAAKVLEALGLPLPTPARASYTLDEFIAQFAAPGGAVRAVKVHKRRTRYTVGGCMAELSEPSATGWTEPCRRTCCARPWRRLRQISRASTGARFPTRWSRWAAR